MRTPFAVIFEARAMREMDEARAWLREHRGGSEAFDAAMSRTLDRLAIVAREVGAMGGRFHQAA